MKTTVEKSPANNTLVKSQFAVKQPPIHEQKSLSIFPDGNPFIQAKLKIGQPNDKYEQEADRVADKVMRIPDAGIADSRYQIANSRSENSSIQRTSKCPECEEDDIQTKPLGDQITPLIQRDVESEEDNEVPENVNLAEEDEEIGQAKLLDGNTIQRDNTEDEEEDKKEEDENKIDSLQTKATPGQTSTMTPALQSQVNSLKGGGKPLSKPERAYFEPRFGFDFSQVRVRTDSRAAETARSVNARAFTKGKDIVFGSGQYSPQTKSGKQLLAHELVHVTQQNKGIISRAVSPKYPKIEDNLTYGIFDWAITDAEAREVLQILKGLKPQDFKDTIRRMEADGLVKRLIENISEEDKKTYSALIVSIQAERSASAVTAHVEDLLSYGFFDWKITDRDARLVLETFKSLYINPERLKAVLRIIKEKQFKRFFRELSSTDRKANKEFLAELKTIRSTGLTRKEARQEFQKYKTLSSDDRKKMFYKEYPNGIISKMLKALSPQDAMFKFEDEVRELLRWIQEVEILKASGKKKESEMIEAQRGFMEPRREAELEKMRKEEAQKKGIPVETLTKKKPIPQEYEKAQERIVAKDNIVQVPQKDTSWEKDKTKHSYWNQMGKKAIEKLVKLCKEKYPELRLTRKNFKANFLGVEMRGKGVLAMSSTSSDGTRVCEFGYKFAITANVNPAYVMSIVVHEVFGHPEYGKYGRKYKEGGEYMLKLYDEAAAKMKGYKQPTDSKKRTAEIDKYAYQGTEIYAHLRSIPYHTPIKPGDRKKGMITFDPRYAVKYRIDMIKKWWEPNMAIALTRGLYMRFSHDPRITPEALEVFKQGVRQVFGKKSKIILK